MGKCGDRRKVGMVHHFFFSLSLSLPSPILPAEKSCMGEPIYIAMFGVPNDKLSTALNIFLFAKMKSGAAAPGPGAYVLTSEGKFRRIICSEARMTLGTERTTATPSSPRRKEGGEVCVCRWREGGWGWGGSTQHYACQAVVETWL